MHKYYCLGLRHWEKILFYTHLVLVIQSLLHFSSNLVFWKDVYWLKLCLHSTLWDSYWKERERLKLENLSLDNIWVSLFSLQIKWEQVVWKMSTRYKSPLCTWYLEVSVCGEPECLTIPLIMKLTILFFIFLYMLPASWWKRIRNLACSTRLVLIPPQSKWCLLLLCTYDAVKRKHEEQLLQITLVCFWCW